jgi:histidyl-tRNA synthetase
VCGGGRYDDLTGVFGMENVSGVGVSFGADRIYDVLQLKDLFPREVVTGTHVLFVNFGPEEEKYILSLLPAFRKARIETEIYPDHAKLKKQMGYANGKGIPFVAMVGENEMSKNVITMKDMETGAQEEMTIEEAIRHVLQAHGT